MQLPPEIRMALENIDFINRYKSMSAKYDFDDEFEYDNHEVLDMLNELGYHARFDKRENFFNIVEELPPCKFEFNISLKYSLLEFIWTVWKYGELQIGDPWGILKKLLDGSDESVRLPGFRNYNDLKEILKEAFLMYEDFKRELLSVYSKE
ncbi:hypothetical protein ACFO25_04915 [Paenactinomyces guangxiensis]|uniref:Uncharacterized protein n=1 Tax=Paenactinomyces guangxiensis TaxID=1490290 RepID=A0A7W1WPJ2_9BACL|nr:hypothetical protein [Paenactinomyces guangxiensis]MBA4493719.1 hypothetical protein [Paenactinomyces guangxiensis]MBH8591007.1 hypothetical protein [Paenactinomyces guangxiensis]